MKTILLMFALMAGTLSAAQAQDGMPKRSKGYSHVSRRSAEPHRKMSKAKTLTQKIQIGQGLDFAAQNPDKFKTSKAAKKYRYPQPKAGKASTSGSTASSSPKVLGIFAAKP